MIEHLRQDHVRLRALIAELRCLLSDDGARIGMCFAAARWALTRELLRHMALERQFLHEHRLENSEVSDRSPHHPDNLERRYRAHLARWTAIEIDTRWSDYCRDLRAMLTILEQCMDLEERTVFLRPGLTARPPAGDLPGPER